MPDARLVGTDRTSDASSAAPANQKRTTPAQKMPRPVGFAVADRSPGSAAQASFLNRAGLSCPILSHPVPSRPVPSRPVFLLSTPLQKRLTGLKPESCRKAPKGAGEGKKKEREKVGGVRMAGLDD